MNIHFLVLYVTMLWCWKWFIFRFWYFIVYLFLKNHWFLILTLYLFIMEIIIDLYVFSWILILVNTYTKLLKYLHIFYTIFDNFTKHTDNRKCALHLYAHTHTVSLELTLAWITTSVIHPQWHSYWLVPIFSK